MTQLSRRQFLQFAGIALASRYFNPLHWPHHLDNRPDENYGRALIAAAVHTHPADSAPLNARLWPDSIIPLHNTSGRWYRTDHGYVARTDIQPMTLNPLTAMTPVLPFWAEVAGSVAPVYQWCAANAPLITRIGHGGVAEITTQLPAHTQGGVWYGITDNAGTLIGWSQAVHWQPIPSETAPLHAVTLHIDQQRQQLTALHRQQAILQAPVATSRVLIPGQYDFRKQRPGALPLRLPDRENPVYAAPWQFSIGDHYTLSGVYWHNSFGQAMPGPAIQVTGLLARWLYHSLMDNVFVTIV